MIAEVYPDCAKCKHGWHGGCGCDLCFCSGYEPKSDLYDCATCEDQRVIDADGNGAKERPCPDCAGGTWEGR